jgi:hypothetical protein
MAANTNFKVHIHGTTDPADCGTISNTATVSSGNDGGAPSTASVVVQCPDIQIVKRLWVPGLCAGDQFVVVWFRSFVHSGKALTVSRRYERWPVT